MNTALVLLEAALLLRLVCRFEAASWPSLTLYLLTAILTTFTYDYLNPSTWIFDAFVLDFIRILVVLECWIKLRGYNWEALGIVLAVGMLAGAALTSAAWFEPHFGQAYLIHLRLSVFISGTLLATLLLAWKWGFEMPGRVWMAAAYMATVPAGPVARYFSNPRSWFPLNDAVYALRIAALGLWLAWELYLPVKTLATHTTKNITMLLHRMLLWTFINIWPPRVPQKSLGAWLAAYSLRPLKPLDPLK